MVQLNCSSVFITNQIKCGVCQANLVMRNEHVFVSCYQGVLTILTGGLGCVGGKCFYAVYQFHALDDRISGPWWSFWSNDASKLCSMWEPQATGTRAACSLQTMRGGPEAIEGKAWRGPCYAGIRRGAQLMPRSNQCSVAHSPGMPAPRRAVLQAHPRPAAAIAYRSPLAAGGRPSGPRSRAVSQNKTATAASSAALQASAAPTDALSATAPRAAGPTRVPANLS